MRRAQGMGASRATIRPGQATTCSCIQSQTCRAQRLALVSRNERSEPNARRSTVQLHAVLRRAGDGILQVFDLRLGLFRKGRVAGKRQLVHDMYSPRLSLRTHAEQCFWRALMTHAA